MLIGTTYGDHRAGMVGSPSADTEIDCEEEPVPLDLYQDIQIVGEVVGAYGLIREEGDVDDEFDDSHMRPYAIVKYGTQIILKTDCAVEPGRNPLWTISSQSIFLFTTTPYQIMHNSLDVSLWFKRKDALNISTLENVFLGRAILSGDQILSNCNEQRMHVDLMDDFEDSGLGSRGRLTLRFRLASKSDETFLRVMSKQYQMNNQSGFTGFYDALASAGARPGEKLDSRNQEQDETQTDSEQSRPIAFLPTEQDEAQVAGTSFVNALSSAFTASRYYDKDAGTEKIRVKPHPDPDRVQETSYMSEADIKRETMAQSKEWVEAGSGTLGKLYLEILCCKNLPNFDVGESVGNLTDAFICAVYEDAMVQTPVIDDELNPHWLPWTQRAFVFGMMHPASMLYLGCFDFDLGLSDHENIGRVAVNISNLQRDTDYTLTYNLYPSSNVTERKANGSITIRLRIEYENEKEAVLAALKPRPKFHVNVKKGKTLKVLHYTCFGEYGDENEEKFDLTVTRSYINEIFEHKRHLSYSIGDGFRSLVFWRRQVRIFGVMLPVHSFLFFCAASTLIERPYLLPSFTLLSVAWIMMATGTLRQQHPSPWYRCPSFWQYVETLKTGRSSLRIRRIQPREGSKATQAYETAWNERVAKDLDAASKREEMKKQLNDLGNEKIHTKMVVENVIPIELLGRLARYQGIIGRYCRYCRFIKIIITWEESIVSFWITACFLVAGLVSLLLPWAFLLTWLGRILVWGCLGPHMMIVDAYLNSSSGDDKLFKKAMEKFNEQSFNARAKYQEALKLKDMKSHRFGQFITLVPNYNLCRYYDRPLATSHARIHKASPLKIASHHVPGQQFFGVIIPRTQAEEKAFSPEQKVLESLLKQLMHTIKYFREQEAAHQQKLSDHPTSQSHTIHYELVPLDLSSREEGDPNFFQLSASSSMHLSEAEQVAVLSFRDSRVLGSSSRYSMKIGYEVVQLLEREEENITVGVPEGKILQDSDEAAVAEISPCGSGLSISRHQDVSTLIRDPVAAMARDLEHIWSVSDDDEDEASRVAAATEDEGIEVVLSCFDKCPVSGHFDDNDLVHGDEKKEADGSSADSTRSRRQSLHVVLYRRS